MDSLVFHIDAAKAGTNLLESIKAYYGSRRVQVIVKPEETTEELIAQNEAATHEYALPYEDLARIANALDHDESVDVLAEVTKFKVTK